MLDYIKLEGSPAVASVDVDGYGITVMSGIFGMVVW